MNKPYITVVVPIYNSKTSIEDIFKNLLKQSDQNFNIIAIVDKPNDIDYESIKKIYSEFGSERFKLIINSNHQLLHKVIQQSLPLVETEYVFIMYSYVYMKSEFTKRINLFFNSAKTLPDFLEISGFCYGLASYKWKQNYLKENTIYNLSENYAPILFASPFTFNNILKTQIVKTIYSDLNYTSFNHQYSIDYVYEGLKQAKTYALITNTWIDDYNHNLTIFNIKNFMDQWEVVFQNTENENQFLHLLLACKIHLQYFLPGYLGSLTIKKSDTKWKSVNFLKNSLLNIINEFDVKYQSYQPQLNNLIKKYNIKKINEKYIYSIPKWKDIFKTY
ncbi:Glycosyl transferase family 2 [Metamycoplasma cloacale]|uniref:Glycosyltransferase family 2 protein n=1 Tax=Metamycoplasma cloacale TaxID=92401 RepID=A0A2Z4LLB1_9BACT|nr:glycosyltransferase family A protein [Metamycoplasma cloacale]AWX42530.1 glycosyltransferase family 2 protein [Metamycoplasma cloacale]VEU79124.1 Glycosyl transferase family 2 [Metamycoplasma cloacale]VEU79812.1 Glycosyl transferase family 2 [Metamycoplasma cloacale]